MLSEETWCDLIVAMRKNLSLLFFAFITVLCIDDGLGQPADPAFSTSQVVSIAVPPGFDTKLYFYFSFFDANNASLDVAKLSLSAWGAPPEWTNSETIGVYPGVSPDAGQLVFSVDGTLYLNRGSLNLASLEIAVASVGSWQGYLDEVLKDVLPPLTSSLGTAHFVQEFGVTNASIIDAELGPDDQMRVHGIWFNTDGSGTRWGLIPVVSVLPVNPGNNLNLPGGGVTIVPITGLGGPPGLLVPLGGFTISPGIPVSVPLVPPLTGIHVGLPQPGGLASLAFTVSQTVRGERVVLQWPSFRGVSYELLTSNEGFHWRLLRTIAGTGKTITVRNLPFGPFIHYSVHAVPTPAFRKK
jgi:hypothetical protein